MMTLINILLGLGWIVSLSILFIIVPIVGFALISMGV